LPKLIDIEKCTQLDLALIFGITTRAVQKWENPPRNEDKTYNLPKIVQWRMEKLSGSASGDLKEQKLRAEIERINAQVSKINENFIERSMHETILTSREASLRAFLEKTFIGNAPLLASRTADELRTMLYSLVKQSMDAYIGAG
jgi:hypothetical protein